MPEKTSIGKAADPKAERKKKVKAGMKKVKEVILQLLTGSIVKDIGDAIDKVHTSAEEKQAALNEAEKIYNERLLLVAELTNPDNDSWLSKNVRPLCLIIALLTLSVILVFDIQVNESLLNAYAKWTGIMMSFYFGVREVVKAVKRNKKT